MIINKPHLCTRLEVWQPRYSDKYSHGERVALLHKQKVDHATSIIIVDFTKAKHLEGQRFATRRNTAQAFDVGTNGTAPMYIVPMSAFEGWESGKEVSEIAFKLFEGEK